MTEKNEQKEIMTMIETILVQFDKTVNAQEELNHQMNRKTSKIILFGSIAMVLLCISLVFIAWSLKQNAEGMNRSMQVVASNVASMNRNMEQTQISLNNMNKGINTMNLYIQSLTDSSLNAPMIPVTQSTEVLSIIAKSVQLMQSDMSGVNKNINHLNYNLNTINKQIKNLNRSLIGINQNTRMPSPSKMFPF
ncbi:MAG: hypothetical protein KAI02_07750 [Gammaproteobacteria bacterium]|nr:hypothetical protein [Gammaproteobacteria bacterium]